ncbi:Conserved hypothetical protein [Clostridium neonatale]|nr:Conserved hypothetical protein [Clostridium neonatale]
MKLFIKQRVFTFADTFVVKDDYGNDRYFVQGEFFHGDISFIFMI